MIGLEKRERMENIGGNGIRLLRTVIYLMSLEKKKTKKKKEKK